MLILPRQNHPAGTELAQALIRYLDIHIVLRTTNEAGILGKVAEDRLELEIVVRHMKRQYSVLRQVLQVDRERFSRQEMGGDRIGAKGVDDQKVEGRTFALFQRQPGVPEHDARLDGAVA